VVRTVRTAGRTVAFSALTVAASLCVMLVFPVAFLRSFAYAGVAVALLAGVFSVVVLPAILALLGHRVNGDAVAALLVPPEQGVWHRVARFVMRGPSPWPPGRRRPAAPGRSFLGLRLTQPDDRSCPGRRGRSGG
jgi:RND superfamily putative drug exporter